MIEAKELFSTQTDPRRAALHTELEATRAAFQTLLEMVSKSGWREKSPSSAWTAGEVFVHLTWALEYLPEEVEKARQGKGMFNMPKRLKRLSDFFSYWYIRWIARKATPDLLGQRYDRAMDASIRLLGQIPVEDWKKGADFYGEGFHSVEDLFHTPARHLAEHTAGWSREL